MRLTFFASPKKVSKERRPWLLRPFASLRATCGARSSRGQKQLASLKQVFALIRLALRSSAHPQGPIGSGDRKPNTQPQYNKDSPWRVLVSSGIRGLVFGCLVFLLPTP